MRIIYEYFPEIVLGIIAVLIIGGLCQPKAAGYDTIIGSGLWSNTANWSSGTLPGIEDTVVLLPGTDDTLDYDMTYSSRIAALKIRAGAGAGSHIMSGRTVHTYRYFHDSATTGVVAYPDSMVVDSGKTSGAEVPTTISANIGTRVMANCILRFTKTAIFYNYNGTIAKAIRSLQVGANATLTFKGTYTWIRNDSGLVPMLVLGDSASLDNYTNGGIDMYCYLTTPNPISLGVGAMLKETYYSGHWVIGAGAGSTGHTITLPALTHSGDAVGFLDLSLANNTTQSLSGDISWGTATWSQLSILSASGHYGTLNTNGFNITCANFALGNSGTYNFGNSIMNIYRFNGEYASTLNLQGSQWTVSDRWVYTQLSTPWTVNGGTSHINFANLSSTQFEAKNYQYNDIEHSGTGLMTVTGNVRAHNLDLNTGKWLFASASIDSVHNYYCTSPDTTYRGNTLLKISGEMMVTTNKPVVGDTSWINLIGNGSHLLTWANHRSERVSLHDSGNLVLASPWRVKYFNDSTAGDSIDLSGYDLYCDSLFRTRGNLKQNGTMHVRGDMRAFSTATATTGTGKLLFDSTLSSTLTNNGGNLGNAEMIRTSTGGITTSGTQRFGKLVLTDGLFDSPDTIYCDTLIDTTSDSTTFNVIFADYIYFGANAKPGFVGADSAINANGCAITVINLSGHAIPDSTFPNCVPRNISGSVSSESASVNGSIQVIVTITGSVESGSATVSGTMTVTEPERNISGSVASQDATATGTLQSIVTISGAVLSQASTVTGTMTVTEPDRNISGAVVSQSVTVTGSIETVPAVGIVRSRKFNFGFGFGF